MNLYSLKYTFILLFFCQVGLGQRNYFPIEDMDDLKTLQSLSSESKKGIMLFICSGFVSDCKAFSKKLDKRETIQYLSNYFLLAEVEGSSSMGRYLIQKYNIQVYPSLLWMAPNTLVVQLNEGVLSDMEIRNKALSAAKRITLLDEFHEAYSLKQLSVNGKKTYLEIAELNRFDSISRPLGEALLYDVFPNLNNDSTLIDVFFKYGMDLSLPFIPYMLDNASIFQEQNPSFPVNLAIEEAFIQQLRNAILNQDTVLLNYLETHFCSFKNPDLQLPSAAKTRLLFLMENQKWMKARKSLSQWVNEMDTTQRKTEFFEEMDVWKLNYQKDTVAIQMFYNFVSDDIESLAENAFKKQFFLAECALIIGDLSKSNDHLNLAQESLGGLSDIAKVQALKRKLLYKARTKSKSDTFFTD